MVLAAKQEVLEHLEAGGVVVDGEHAHADGELVPGPMPAFGLPLQLHLLHRHLPAPGYANPTAPGGIKKQETQARPDHRTPCVQEEFLGS